MRIPNVLSIAGTDPTGGAGAQADLKSISAAGGYGMNVVTALVAQNTQGVRSIHVPPMDFLLQQLEAVSQDVRIDAIKVGMLGSAEIIDTVTSWLKEQGHIPVVVDPVMIATSGDRLLKADAEQALREFLRLATMITPNIPELAVLAETQAPTTWEEACSIARSVARKYDTAVVVKGGHLVGADAGNALVTAEGVQGHWPSPRIDTPNTHGTGCSLSSALATRIARGQSLPEALAWSTRWIADAISAAADPAHLQVGHGNGPISHFHRLWAQAAAADTTPLAFHAGLSALAADTPDHLLPTPTNPVLPARIPAAGPWTQALWDGAAGVWHRITELPFIKQLGNGTLAPEDFTFYQDQDAQYLRSYSKALAMLAVKAPDPDAQAFWAAGAAECLTVESSLHVAWLGADYHTQGPSGVTRAYTDFLTATALTQDYAVGVAAVLPCYWLYAEVGRVLASHNHDSHPYHAWLSMYSGSDFEAATSVAIDHAEQALAAAPATQRLTAAAAFLQACYHELWFFDQASRRG